MTESGKIAVSLPMAQIEAARRAVHEGRAASVSSYVSQALAQRLQEEALSDIVAAWIAEDGVPSAIDYAWAQEVFAQAQTPRPATS